MATALGDWPARCASADEDAPDADVVVRLAGHGYEAIGRYARGLVYTCSDAWEAVNAASGLLVGAFVVQDPALAAVHAAAVGLHRGLVLLVGESGVGKSTMAVHLTAAGGRYFGDDRMVLRLDSGAGEGIGLGLCPKLRLPLAPSFTGSRLSWLQARAIDLAGGVIGLSLRPDEKAAFGARAPLAACVLPERTDDGSAPEDRLQRATSADMVNALLRHAFAPGFDSQVLVGRLADLSRTVPCYNLRYADSAAAARVLLHAFGPASSS
jgi:hypothetical protein